MHLAALRLGHALVIVDAVERRNVRVAPAVIVDQLAAASFERAEIRIHCVKQCSELRIGVINIAIETSCRSELERLEVPIRIVENHELEKRNAQNGVTSGAW